MKQNLQCEIICIRIDTVNSTICLKFSEPSKYATFCITARAVDKILAARVVNADEITVTPAVLSQTPGIIRSGNLTGR